MRTVLRAIANRARRLFRRRKKVGEIVVVLSVDSSAIKHITQAIPALVRAEVAAAVNDRARRRLD